MTTTNDSPTPSYNSSDQARSTIETVHFPIFGDECTFDLVTLGIENQWGRVSGMNGFGDREKAQALTFDSHASYRIVGAMVWFERPAVVGDGTLICKIYSPHPDDGRPDRLIGQSDAVKASEVIPPDSMSYPTIFSFENGAPIIPDMPSFMLSCDFSNLYNTFDTIVMLQTIDGCGDGGNSWELFSDGQTWTNIASSISWELNADFVMAAVVDFEDPSAVHTFIEHNQLKIYPPRPNPASDETALLFELESTQQVSINLLDASGKQIEKRDLGIRIPSLHTEIVNVSDFQPGVYYYQISAGKSTITSRLLVQ